MPSDSLRRCVGDPDAFATQHWGRAPLLRRRVGTFHDLLDMSAIEVLLTDFGRRPTFRLVREGGPVPITDYTVRTRVGGVDLDDVADVDRILEHVAHGATVVMQGLQRFWPPLGQFCLDLEADLGHAVQANAYLSPPSAAGLGRHADDHDVIVVQVSGAKQWVIDGIGDVSLAAGDVVYLPAGTHHAGADRGDREPPHHAGHPDHDRAGRAPDGALDAIDDAELDRPLVLGFRGTTPPGRSSSSSAMRSPTRRHLADADARPRGTRGRPADRRARRRWIGRLAAVVDPASVDDTTTVRRRRYSHQRRGRAGRADDSGPTALPPGTTIEALRRLSAPEHLSVGELPGLDAADRVVLVRRLVREGVVQIVT